MDEDKCVMPEIPEKARRVKAFIVMEILEKAQEMERAGHNISHLEVGEPDFDTPEVVVEAAKEALEKGKTHYTHSMGLIELREAIAEDYKNRYSVEVDPSCIIVTSGTSAAMSLVFSVLLEKGREVVLTNPHYACYPNFIEFADGSPKYVPVDENTGFQYTKESLKAAISPSVATILVNSPSNPGGTVLAKDILDYSTTLGAPVISDEIYHGLVYDGEAHSVLEFSPDAFVINGFSKLYAMTGWRVGYVIAPKKYIRTMQKLQQNFYISANSFVQWAAIAALKEAGPDVEKMMRTYDERRRFMVAGLRDMGFRIPVEPTGAFYAMVNAKHLGEDSYKLAFKILEEAKVAVTPGIDFGSNGEGHIRLSYASSMETIKEGLKRLSSFVKENS